MVAAVGGGAGVATAAEQDQKDDDPAQVTATEVIVTHNDDLRDLEFSSSFAAHSKIFRSRKKVTLFGEA